MCCSTAIFPVDRETAEAILALGMFVAESKPDGYGPPYWEREHPMDWAAVCVGFQKAILGEIAY